MMKFGEWLASQLGEQRITMRELARKNGVSHSTIGDIISGKREPTRKFCIAIAHGISKSPEQVLARADFKTDVDDLIKTIEKSELFQMIDELSDDERSIVSGVVKTLREQRRKYKV